jgi:hypothetical protein
MTSLGKRRENAYCFKNKLSAFFSANCGVDVAKLKVQTVLPRLFSTATPPTFWVYGLAMAVEKDT